MGRVPITSVILDPEFDRGRNSPQHHAWLLKPPGKPWVNGGLTLNQDGLKWTGVSRWFYTDYILVHADNQLEGQWQHVPRLLSSVSGGWAPKGLQGRQMHASSGLPHPPACQANDGESDIALAEPTDARNRGGSPGLGVGHVVCDREASDVSTLGRFHLVTCQSASATPCRITGTPITVRAVVAAYRGVGWAGAATVGRRGDGPGTPVVTPSNTPAWLWRYTATDGLPGALASVKTTANNVGRWSVGIDEAVLQRRGPTEFALHGSPAWTS